MEGEKQVCEGEMNARLESHCRSHDPYPVSFQLVHKRVKPTLRSIQASLNRKVTVGKLLQMG